MKQVAEFYGIDSCDDNKPTEARISWMYPEDGSTLTVDICHVRVIDEVRLRFDFQAHEWVAEMEELGFFDTDHSPPSGNWVEVARWSGNAPQSTRPGPGRNMVQM
jgi:hypothetical protein